VELSPLAAAGMYDDEAPGAGVFTRVGRGSGRECVVVNSDATVGAFLPRQDEVLPDREHFGRMKRKG
jgi:3-methylcrotonyl-CoA carboxylase beta subunit